MPIIWEDAVCSARVHQSRCHPYRKTSLLTRSHPAGTPQPDIKRSSRLKLHNWSASNFAFTRLWCKSSYMKSRLKSLYPVGSMCIVFDWRGVCAPLYALVGRWRRKSMPWNWYDNILSRKDINIILRFLLQGKAKPD